MRFRDAGNRSRRHPHGRAVGGRALLEAEVISALSVSWELICLLTRSPAAILMNCFLCLPERHSLKVRLRKVKFCRRGVHLNSNLTPSESPSASWRSSWIAAPGFAGLAMTG